MHREDSSKEIDQPLYLKIETNDKMKIASLFGDAIENPVRSRAAIQRLDNGNYYMEIIQQSDEPPVI